MTFIASCFSGYYAQIIFAQNYRIGLFSLIATLLFISLTIASVTHYIQQPRLHIKTPIILTIRLLLCSALWFLIGIKYGELEYGFLYSESERILIIASTVFLTILSSVTYFVPLAFVAHDQRLGNIDVYKKKMKLSAELFAFGSVLSASLAVLKTLPNVENIKTKNDFMFSNIMLQFFEFLHNETVSLVIYMILFSFSISASCLKIRLAYLDRL